jgi:hypothetical protein
VRRIASGKLSPGVGVKEEKNVPGMPNITNLDWVVRARADYRLNKERETPSSMVGDTEKVMDE